MTDVKVNLFEIAYLTWEQVNLFRSDFKEVARYFVQMRESGDYKPSDDELAHIESVLQLLNVMDKDHRFETAINKRKEVKGVRKMSEWLTKVINENQAIGMAKGRAEGQIATLTDLVRKNLISVKDAAEQAGLSEMEF
ncbi:MAG: transposase, partial [Clostridia bacterium]